MPRPFERLFQSLKVDRTSSFYFRYESKILNVTPKLSQQKRTDKSEILEFKVKVESLK
jgi:hypothetical protein